MASTRSLRAVGVLVVVAVLTVSGCSAGATGSPDAASSSSAPCTPGATSAPELADIAPVTDPRTITGPSTACLSSDSIADAIVDADPQPQLPVTVTDNQGTEVTVTDVSRILALDMAGTLAATVFSLGLGENVVGRDTSTGFAEAAGLPEVTHSGHQLSAEAILALAPTVIITDSSIGPWDVVLQMRQAGIPVVVVSPDRSLDTVGTLTQSVADALGVSAEGEALVAHLAQQIETTEATISSIAPTDPGDKLRILFLYVRGNAGVYYIFGSESGADALITSLGGIDVAGESGIVGMRPMTAEALVEAAPDVVLVMTKGLESVDGVDGLLERVPAIATTPAGQNRRIVDMADDQILSFGPRTPAVLDALAVALYGAR